MGYVYKYTDLDDLQVKYVGIVYGERRTLRQRIGDHAREKKFRNKRWKIEFFSADINTRTDAEYYEAHFISLYGTDKWLNKSKAGWGISTVLSREQVVWLEWFDGCEKHYETQKTLKNNKWAKEQEELIRELKKEMEEDAREREEREKEWAEHDKKMKMSTYFYELFSKDNMSDEDVMFKFFVSSFLHNNYHVIFKTFSTTSVFDILTCNEYSRYIKNWIVFFDFKFEPAKISICGNVHEPNVSTHKPTMPIFVEKCSENKKCKLNVFSKIKNWFMGV